MVKLYKTVDSVMIYWETWKDGNDFIIHWGTVGEQGETQTLKNSLFSSSTKRINELIQDKKNNGFSEIPEEKLFTLIIEYNIGSSPNQVGEL